MVGTRNSTIETRVDDSIKNWVTDHVNEKFDAVNTTLNNILAQLNFVVTDVNRLKGNEGTSSFSRMGKLEFPKFYGEDFIKAHGETVVWGVYEDGILKRFGIVNEDLMAELKKLSMFISGLPASMEMNVRMFKPQTLANAFSLANFQEASLAVIKQRATPVLSTPKFNNNYYANRNVASPNKDTTVTAIVPNTQVVNKYPALPSPAPRRMLSQKEFVDKRAKNQCFHCDKKNVPGHKCEGQVFTLEIRGTHIEECLEEEEEESDMISYELSDPTPQTSSHILLNALSGIPTRNTIRWLSTLGTIQWNFKDLVMKFQYEGQKVVLRGTHKSELAWLNGRHMSKLVSQHGKAHISALCCVGQTATLNLMQCNIGQEMVLGVDLAQLLQEYADVFNVPKELPPQSSFDHKIPLREENVCINIRPYRYPPSQKDTIKAMVKELLDSGVITPSTSTFSSPVVMAKNKDESWRMCIDYKQLNKQTVKDRWLGIIDLMI
ncbi:hypothetical protein Tco_0858659 [Tanacetum coccineum]|uniref:Uncharacterized protein n=1 Tax=Tanacetum coccineum TaxID=301880 RepID=A0ABQ5BCQ1_9ASTR